ncbi:MAG TPA: tol-pal system protein YbgF [Thermoanaerobaculia bacterium]|nr:tol-pal system protein YbgF [Thermoanaerobaculia bacterium]
MIRRRLAVAGLALALPLAGACSSAVMPARASDAADLRQEVEEVKNRLVEMERQARVQQLAIQELEAQVVALGGRPRTSAVARPDTTARPGTASRPGTTAERAPARRVLPPREERIEPIPDPGRGLDVSDVEVSDVPVARPEPRPSQPPPAQTSRPQPTAQPAPPAAVAEAPIPPAGQALYDRGYTLYHQGVYLDAEASFQRFLQAHGDTDLADNAQYWIGEARYARGDYRGALAAFRETVSRFPGGNKVPDALLKAGQSLEQLADPEGARDTYRALVQQHPASAAAAVAEERLARLR